MLRFAYIDNHGISVFPRLAVANTANSYGYVAIPFDSVISLIP